ncbi:MAG: hypothetical protein AAGA96_02145 [Verrucomicrobiota bacterium]
MKTVIWIGFGVTCFVVYSNAQEAGTERAATAFNTQGSASHNRAIREAEQQRAVAEARELKALKASMSVVHPAAASYTTAEQFLAANRPPMPPVSAVTEPTPIRHTTHVPDFETSAPRLNSQPSQSSGVIELPSQRGGFLNFLKRKPTEEPFYGATVSESELPNPYTPEGIEITSAPPLYDVSGPSFEGGGDAVREIIPGERGGLFGRFFKRQPEPVVQEMGPGGELRDVDGETIESVPAETADQWNVTSDNVVEPPQWAQQVPAPASSVGDAPIFVQPQAVEATQRATVAESVKAQIEGVRVMLHEGTQVGVINRAAHRSTIQLPDSRVGTVETSALRF